MRKHEHCIMTIIFFSHFNQIKEKWNSFSCSKSLQPNTHSFLIFFSLMTLPLLWYIIRKLDSCCEGFGLNLLWRFWLKYVSCIVHIWSLSSYKNQYSMFLFGISDQAYKGFLGGGGGWCKCNFWIIQRSLWWLMKESNENHIMFHVCHPTYICASFLPDYRSWLNQ